MAEMKKRTGIGRYLSEWGALLTVERRKKQLLDLENAFLEKHRHELMLSIPSGPVRQDHIIQYREMAGWKPFREEMREMSEIDPLHKQVIRDAKESFAIADKSEQTPSECAPVSDAFWQEFEEVAHSMAVDLIGYAPVSRDLIFQDKGILFENAIVLGMEMKAGPISEAPKFVAGKETLRVYNSSWYASFSAYSHNIEKYRDRF